MAQTTKKHEEVQELAHRLPTEDEVRSAHEAAIALANARDDNGALVFSGLGDGEVRLAPAIGNLVIDLVAEIASGNMVTLVPTGAQLTTAKAADMLNVSRPFLSKLLKSGKIDYTMVGTHRRVKLDDLMAYKEKRDARQNDAIDEIARLGQEYDAR